MRKTMAISVAVQGQDSMFDAVADSVSTQVRLGDFFVCGFGVVSLNLGILCTRSRLSKFWSYFSEQHIGGEMGREGEPCRSPTRRPPCRWLPTPAVEPHRRRRTSLPLVDLGRNHRETCHLDVG